MRIKLSYVIVGGLIYYFMFRKSSPVYAGGVRPSEGYLSVVRGGEEKDSPTTRWA